MSRPACGKRDGGYFTETGFGKIGRRFGDFHAQPSPVARNPSSSRHPHLDKDTSESNAMPCRL